MIANVAASIIIIFILLLLPNFEPRSKTHSLLVLLCINYKMDLDAYGNNPLEAFFADHAVSISI
jgi:hypothetical protein